MLTVTGRRTLKHGDLIIVAIRPNQVEVGGTLYSSSVARKMAMEMPPGADMAVKLLEQADWAEGRDL